MEDRSDPNKFCQVDLEPSEPGHYLCEEPLDSKFPHHVECGQHHAPGANCEEVAAIRAIDDQLRSYAQG